MNPPSKKKTFLARVIVYIVNTYWLANRRMKDNAGKPLYNHKRMDFFNSGDNWLFLNIYLSLL